MVFLLGNELLQFAAIHALRSGLELLKGLTAGRTGAQELQESHAQAVDVSPWQHMLQFATSHVLRRSRKRDAFPCPLSCQLFGARIEP